MFFCFFSLCIISCLVCFIEFSLSRFRTCWGIWCFFLFCNCGLLPFPCCFHNQFVCLSLVKGVLSLFNISTETSGYYICTSSNKIQSASCNLTLSVMPCKYFKNCVCIDQAEIVFPFYSIGSLFRLVYRYFFCVVLFLSHRLHETWIHSRNSWSLCSCSCPPGHHNLLLLPSPKEKGGRGVRHGVCQNLILKIK